MGPQEAEGGHCEAEKAEKLAKRQQQEILILVSDMVNTLMER